MKPILALTVMLASSSVTARAAHARGGGSELGRTSARALRAGSARRKRNPVALEAAEAGGVKQAHSAADRFGSTVAKPGTAARHPAVGTIGSSYRKGTSVCESSVASGSSRLLVCHLFSSFALLRKPGLEACRSRLGMRSRFSPSMRRTVSTTGGRSPAEAKTTRRCGRTAELATWERCRSRDPTPGRR